MLVCLSVGQDSERRCNGRTDQEFIWDVDTWGFRNHVLVGPRFPPPSTGWGALWEDIHGHAQSAWWSIFSTLFTIGQQQCGLWIPVYLFCSDVELNAGGRCSLEEVRKALQERMQRWQLIERICGFDIMSNPGLPALDLQMKPALKKGVWFLFFFELLVICNC